MGILVSRPGAGGDPFDASAYYTKSEINVLFDGVTWKEPVVAAGTVADGSIDVGAPPPTLDSVTLAVSKRYGLLHQDDGAENGIYVFSGAILTRAGDLDESLELDAGVAFQVKEGASAENKDQIYVLKTDPPITIGTTPLEFIRVTSNISAADVIIFEGLINHDNLSGFVAAEHIDWAAAVGSGDDLIHIDNIPAEISKLSWAWTGSRNDTNHVDQDMNVGGNTNTNLTPLIIPVACTLLYITASNENIDQSWNAHVLKENITVANEAVVGGTTGAPSLLNISFAAGEKVRLRKRNTTGGITGPQITAFFKAI